MILSCEIRVRSETEICPLNKAWPQGSPNAFLTFPLRLISVNLLFCDVKRSCQTMLHTTAIGLRYFYKLFHILKSNSDALDRLYRSNYHMFVDAALIFFLQHEFQAETVLTQFCGAENIQKSNCVPCWGMISTSTWIIRARPDNLRLHLKTKWPYDYKKNSPGLQLHRQLNHENTTSPSPGLHLHPTGQPCKHDFTLTPNDHMIIKKPPGLHLHPTTQPCKYDFTLEPNDHVIIKKPSLDFTCIQRLNHANTSSL